MNEVIRQLHERKSVRAFENRPIDPAIKREILLAACAAPTAGNQQMYTILDITDKDLQKQLSVTCDNQPFIADAALVLIFCADFKKWFDLYELENCKPRLPDAGDFVLSVQDAVIAAQNAVTAAHSFGLGSCYIGDIMENCEQHRAMLNLPQYVFPAAMVVFGYPTKQQQDREKPAVASFRTLCTKTPTALWNGMNCTTCLITRKVFCLLKSGVVVFATASTIRTFLMK